jgi:oligosaccharide repeat unit polymerase
MESIVGTIIGGRDFADIVTLAHIVRTVPDRLSLEYGKTLWVLVTRPIPRSIWPNKPVNHGIELKNVLFNRHWLWGGSTPPTLIGELYWNFHIPGVIVGMWLLGLIVRASYEYVRHYSDNLFVITLYCITIYALMKTLNHDLSIGLTSYLIMVSYLGFTIVFTGLWKRQSPLPYIHRMKKVP